MPWLQGDEMRLGRQSPNSRSRSRARTTSLGQAEKTAAEGKDRGIVGDRDDRERAMGSGGKDGAGSGAKAAAAAKKDKPLATVEVLDSGRPDLGLGPIRRCAMPFGPELSVEGMRTLFEVFRRSVDKRGDRPCLGSRPVGEDGEPGPFSFMTYNEVHKHAMAFSHGVVHLDVVHANDEGHKLLGFFAVNRPGVVMCEIGAMAQRIVPVPLYATLGTEAVEHIIDQTQMEVIVCTSSELEDTLSKSEEVMKQLSTIILLDEDLGDARLDELRKIGADAEVKVYTVADVEELGEAHEGPLDLPSGDDLAVLCYTSGSTGTPKGVLITHSSIISAVASLRRFGIDVHEDDVHLSYLPLAHIFERALMYAMLYGGASVGFFRGSSKAILADLKALRPTIFPTVPRLLNKMHDSIWSKVRETGGAKQVIFENALQAKLENLHGVTTRDKLNALLEDSTVTSWLFQRTVKDKVEDLRTGRIIRQIAGGSDEDVERAGGLQQWLFEKALRTKSHQEPSVDFSSSEGEVTARSKKPLSDQVFDRVVFDALKKKIGLDRTRIIAVGSAPITGEVLDFFRCMLGIPVLNAFGSTESSCVISLTHPEDLSSGHVGIPAPCNEVRLTNVDDMGYKATDTEHNGVPCLGRGEICFRGPNVFKGYYKMKEKTEETLTKDGWCLTGDIGMWTEDGMLKIIDRKKNLFKLAQGEYVAPEKVENAYCRADLLESMFVYGDSEKSNLVAIIHPDADVVSEVGLQMEDSKELHDRIQDELDKQADAAGLKGFERVRAFHIETRPFTEVEGITTATQKIKRAAAKEHYEDIIEKLYKEIDE